MAVFPGRPDQGVDVFDGHSWRHFDHTDGNEALHAPGVSILAHANTRERLATPQVIRLLDMHFPASPAKALPTQTFDRDFAVYQNGDQINLAHFDPAHTDTDIYIHFHNANVLHAGDTWFNGMYPFIDEATGGRIGGMIAAAEKSLAVADDNTKIIPGHGPLGSKADLKRSHDMLSAIRLSIAYADLLDVSGDRTPPGR